MRALCGLLAILLVAAALSLAAPTQAGATPEAGGTRADGNSYSILWVLVDRVETVRSVKIAGRRAELRSGGYWEVVLTGPWRRRDVRQVEITRPRSSSLTFVRFAEVPW